MYVHLMHFFFQNNAKGNDKHICAASYTALASWQPDTSGRSTHMDWLSLCRCTIARYTAKYIISVHLAHPLWMGAYVPCRCDTFRPQ